MWVRFLKSPIPIHQKKTAQDPSEAKRLSIVEEGDLTRV
jgi:hypothetical protein